MAGVAGAIKTISVSAPLPFSPCDVRNSQSWPADAGPCSIFVVLDNNKTGYRSSQSAASGEIESETFSRHI